MKILLLIFLAIIFIFFCFLVYNLVDDFLGITRGRKRIYRYNPETSRYEILKPGYRKRFILLFFIVFSAAIFTIGYFPLAGTVGNDLPENKVLYFTYDYSEGPEASNQFSLDMERMTSSENEVVDTSLSYVVLVSDLFDTAGSPEGTAILYRNNAELFKASLDTGSEVGKLFSGADLSKGKRSRKRVEIRQGKFQRVLVKSDKRWGDIHMIVDSVMYLGRGHKALLVVTKTGDTARLNAVRAKFQPNATAVQDHIDSIPDKAEVTANLFPAAGNDYFAITPSEKLKNVLNLKQTKSMTFQWIVTPRQRGYNDLALQVRLDKVGGVKEVPTVPDKVYTVFVMANEMKGLDKIVYWIKEYYVLLSVSGAILVFLVTYLVKRKKGTGD